MSTGRDSVVGGSAAAVLPKPYFCYQCNSLVSIVPIPSADLFCPNCSGGFLEEQETPAPAPAPSPNPNPQFRSAASPSPNSSSFFSFSSSPTSSSSSEFFGSGFPFLLGDDGHHNDHLNPPDLTSALFEMAGGGGIGMSGGGGSRGGGHVEVDQFNPMMFLQNYLTTMMGAGNIQFVVNGGESGGLGGNLGDYFVGPGLEQLIQQLAENDPNRYGTPPASKEAVEKLPDVDVTNELLASDDAQCAVCMDTFELGGKAKQMPCKHIYHSDCILPWLELHNSCPVCRHELPTDDPDYEQHAASGQRGHPRTAGVTVNLGSAGGSGVLSEGNSGTARGERSFSIQFPWSFNLFGGGSDGNNPGEGGGGGNNNGGNSAGRSQE